MPSDLRFRRPREGASFDTQSPAERALEAASLIGEVNLDRRASTRQRRRRGLARLALLLGSLLSLAALVFKGASAQGASAAPAPQATPSPLSAQLDHGDLEYRLVCSACHAYSGEGLTQAWLSTWGPPDQNCWQSKCHAVNHPPDGFVLPHFVPAIAGPGTLVDMKTAEDLFRFIHADMPYQDPGYLTEQDYWDITAHILTLNAIPVGPDPVGPANAGAIVLHRASAAASPVAPGAQQAGPIPPTHPRASPQIATGSLAAVAGGLIVLLLLVAGVFGSRLG